MELAWIATDPASGRLTFTESRSDIGGFLGRLNQLLSIGEGYTEVHRAETAFPLLTLSFKKGYGVVHLFSSEGDCRLLLGDGVVPATETIDVPVHGEDSGFSGDVVSTVARASSTIVAFVRGAGVEELGEWDRL